MGAFLASRFMTDVFIGVEQGVIYALVALSLVIIWQSTHVLNFAQGAMAMFVTYIGLTQVGRGVPYAWCALLAVAAGFIAGGLTERVLIRPLYGKPEINPIVVMVGFLTLLEAVAASTWGETARFIPSPFSQVNWEYRNHTIALSPFDLFTIILALAIMAIMAILFRYTKLGLKLRAAALAPEVARLLGVRVNRMLTLGWMLSSAVGAVAAIVVGSGVGGLTPNMMDTIFVSGFIAAAIGGLESPIGAVVGGLALGLIVQFVQDYWSGNVALATPLVLLLLVLMLRPRGIFTKTSSRRV